uniref:Uncharacterized protein n=1 Tax=viral metagenome TaxID=1070528 RepID=A0A6C0HZM9_9ZZZZ
MSTSEGLKEIKELQKKYNAIVIENEQFHSIIADFKQFVAALISNQLTSHLVVEEQAKLRRCEIVRDEQIEEIAHLRKEVEIAHKLFISKKEIMNFHKKELASRDEIIASQAAQIASQAAKIASQAAQIASQAAQIEKLNNMHISSQRDIEYMQNERKSMQQERKEKVDELYTIISDMQQERKEKVDELYTIIADMQQERKEKVDELYTIIADMEEERDQVQEQYDKLRAQHNQVKIECDQVQEQYNQLQSTIGQYIKQIARLKTNYLWTIIYTNTELKEQRAKIKEQRSKIKEQG